MKKKNGNICYGSRVDALSYSDVDNIAPAQELIYIFKI